MELFGFITACSLLVLAVLLIAYLFILLVAPVRELFRNRSEAARVRRGNEQLERVDDLIAKGKTRDALRVLRRALVFNHAHTDTVVETMREHHQNFLSRVLLLSEEFGNRPANIAEVERLLMERSELQTLLLKALDSFRSLRFRRERAGKNIPDWSKTDFEGRIKEIRKELSKNHDLLEKALDQLFKAIQGTPTENILYH